MFDGDYVNGYIERVTGGRYEGRVTIDGVRLDNIEGVYFERKGRTYLWLKRKPKMEYDMKTGKFIERPSTPAWETYLEKTATNGAVAFKGECIFMRFRYSVTGIWDAVLGKDKQRLNLFIERMADKDQTIIRNINESIKRRKKI